MHAMLPLIFDAGTAAVVSALLAATLYTWWASMKVAALLISSSGPLAEYADAPASQFWCVFFLPVTPIRGDSSPTRRRADSPRKLRLYRARPHAGAFCAKLLVMLALFVLLNPRGDELPIILLLSPGLVLGDLAWLMVVLLAASALMDISSALAEALGVRVLPAFDQPLLASSLTSFWAHRWNLTASRLLRECAYRPCREYLGLPRPLAIGVAFGVSGVAHELIVWYGSGDAYASVRGRWLAFFSVQGMLTAAEHAGRTVLVAKLGATRLPHSMWSRLWAAGALLGTARLLFLPPAYRLKWPFLMSDAALAIPRAFLLQ